MKDYLSFDIEIFNELPEGKDFPDLKEIIPSVGAFCTDVENVSYYWDKPYMTKETCQKMVKDIQQKVSEGYYLFGWNILNFDLPIIAYYSGMMEEVGKLAISAIDPMFMIVCIKGHFLGLDIALAGHRIESKLHTVSLNDGSSFEMNGSKAPLLFRNGEYQAVLDYLKYDVIQPYKLAFSIEEKGGIRWTSKSGKNQFVSSKLLTVKECLSIEKPDTSWMSNAPIRENFYSWIPENVLQSEGVI